MKLYLLLTVSAAWSALTAANFERSTGFSALCRSRSLKLLIMIGSSVLVVGVERWPRVFLLARPGWLNVEASRLFAFGRPFAEGRVLALGGFNLRDSRDHAGLPCVAAHV